MPNTGDRAVGVTLKIRRSRSGTEAPWTALAAEDEWPCYLPTITATAFLAISAAVSFASFTALILELACTPKPSAIAARLCLFDEIFWRRESLRAVRCC
jgi:hypothetical protein